MFRQALPHSSAGIVLLLAAFGTVAALDQTANAARPQTSVTVPFILDHNRMLVDAEIQRADGSWRAARLWVDTGNPTFFMSVPLACDIGVDTSSLGYTSLVAPVKAVRIGGMPVDFDSVETRAIAGPRWLFSTMHNDGNLPSSVLMRYDVVFDYPAQRLTIAKPGSLEHRGARAPAAVNPHTGIVQIDAVVDGDTLSFALDNGASYSFVDSAIVDRLAQRHPKWPRMTGTFACANMWGWWPPSGESSAVILARELRWGGVKFGDVGLVGVGAVAPGGPALGAWYSRKAARPVNGLLGPNAFKAFRVEIDYAGGTVYFEKRGAFDSHDMDLVGLAIRPEADGSYSVIGVASVNGKPAVEGVEVGDRLLRVGDLEVTGATMGTVIDALRGKPGDKRTMVLERKGAQLTVTGAVNRLL